MDFEKYYENIDTDCEEEITESEIFELIRNIPDPEHPLSLE